MSYTNRAPTRILSIFLVVIFLVTSFPVTAFAAIDEPLNGVTGNGWDDIDGGVAGADPYVPPATTQPSDGDEFDDNSSKSDDTPADDPDSGSNDGGSEEADSPPIEDDNETEADALPKVATAGTLGLSGPLLDLPPDVEAEFIAFLASVEEIIESKPLIMPLAAPGDTGRVSWTWGESVGYTTTMGHYIGSIPRLTLSTANPTLGDPFCAKFGVDPNTSATYTASAGSNQQILKLLIAYHQGSASAVGVQMAIWSITNHTSFRNHSEAQAAWSAASSVSTAGFSYLEWSASGQPFYTLEEEAEIDWKLKIIKLCAETDKLLSGAEFSVSGPGVNQTGLTTNNKGEILVNIPSPGGTYTVTETAPPEGYLPADPASQTVTINMANPSGTVTFVNDIDEENPPEEGEESSFRVEVEVEVVTDVTVQNEKEIEYSRAYGQVTIRKDDQDGKSLDGALFNIEVRFTDGTVLRENNWEVDNGARLFTYTHPENNHDAATITVREAQPPLHYTGDPSPKTVTVQPSYTRTVISTTWTETIWTYFYRYTVIEITSDGEETEVDSWTESRDEFEVTPGNVENFPEYVPGDREITVTFINVRERGQLIVTKRDANTGQALAGAQVHVKGVDLGNAGTYDVILSTGSDGRAVFNGLFPGSYSIQEIQAPFGYNLNSQVQAVTIQSNETVHREIHNTRRAGLFIKKVDQNGQPIAGATFELRRGSGEVLIREVTDLNGIIYRGYLTTDTYVVEEIKAPEGYLLDENNPQSIYISNADDNKEFTLTFVNKKKPAIEIEKVDGTTPTLKLAGAVFRITDTRTGNYWDVQTGRDGKALLESLEIGTTYMVEEITAPEGYVNSGYREEIVLREARVHTLTISNEQKPSLKIIKKDAKTGGRLAGATFRLAKEGSSSFQDVTTGSQYGEVLVPDLAPGTYILTEIKAPTGYILNITPQTVIIRQGKHTVVEVTNHQKSTLTLIKKDALTGKMLEGAIFRFAKEGSVDYRDVTIDKGGTVKIGDIEPGTYILTEIKAPNGYLISYEPVTVILADGEHKIIELVNYKRPSLEIVKKDKETGALLAGATFRVSWNSGADYQDVTTGANGKAVVTGLNDGWYTVTEIKAPAGYLLVEEPQQILLKPGEAGVIEIFNEAKPSLTILKVDNVTKTPLRYAKFRIERKTDAGTTLIGEYVSDEDGIVYLDNILPGRYLITEIQAPDGYDIDNTSHEVTIEFGKVYKVEFTNTAKSPIYIQKVDDKGNPLMGAKFKVTTMNGAMVGTVTSGRTGYAIIPYVEPGWYIIDEIQAPDGYILSSTPVNVEVKSGRPAQVEFVNHKKPQLSLLKLDSADNKALMGARIKVEKTSGEIVGTFTSDRNGLVILTDLEAGSYTVTEIAAPDGYILDSTPQIVELKAGESKQIELYNTPKPGLQLRKIDKLTNKPVANAVFSLVRLESGAKRDLGTFTTGENGLFYVPDLSPGNYVITEITAPAGYILDPTPQSIYIEGGKLNTVEVFNIPYSSLRIVKISANDDGKPLPGASFKLYDEKRLEIGTYETSALGEIVIEKLPAGVYYLQETKAPAGYILDSTVRKVELIGGKTTVVEVKNKELGSLRIIKRNKEDGKPLYGATFLLYDGKNNLLGEFLTDNNGLITFGRNLAAGNYKLKEIKAPEGFVLDDTIRTIAVKEGETTEIVVENEPKRGRIQITKVSSGYNNLTKDKEGALLKGAKFEIYNNKMELVDTIESDKSGLCTSDYLPLGVYGVKEVSSPDYYFTDGEMFYAELKIHDDLVKFKVVNEPVHIETSVEKRGVVEAMAGSSIYYDITGVENKSNVPLEEFYLHDVLPTDAVRLEKIWTGVWSERVKMELQIKTNLKSSYRTVKKGLLSTTNNEVDCSRSALGLAANEYVTEFKLVFGEVQPGFHETTGVKVQVRVLDDVENGQKFTNKIDAGGRYIKEWVYDTDGWTSVAYNKPRGDLPKTGR